MSRDHQARQKTHLIRHCEESKEGGDKGSGGKTSESGQDWTFLSHDIEAAGGEVVGGDPMAIRVMFPSSTEL